jgi:predicted RNA methylase
LNLSLARQKALGAYYTPHGVVAELRRWIDECGVTGPLVDPSCGDGRFIVGSDGAFGIDLDPHAVTAARANAPQATVVESDFFAWAATTRRRFGGVVGNPPFIRYQRFSGAQRDVALKGAQRCGVSLTALSSAWAPFVVVAASLLRPGGALALVVPAEIGHAAYAAPVVRYLCDRFARVRVVAFRERIFPELSEDCWVLQASGFGGTAEGVEVEAAERLGERGTHNLLSRATLERIAFRLRAGLVPAATIERYLDVVASDPVKTLGDVTRLGIGYVTGDNDFFHLRPSTAAEFGIPAEYLQPTVRSGRDLNVEVLSHEVVEKWLQDDRAVLLLRLRAGDALPPGVLKYLDTAEGRVARESYKCRNRTPWYVVPDVVVPDGFLSVMSGEGPRLIANGCGATGTNSLHMLRMTADVTIDQVRRAWTTAFTQLSIELEGHPLGGGMLKLEPTEARRVAFFTRPNERIEQAAEFAAAAALLKRWRTGGPSM